MKKELKCQSFVYFKIPAAMQLVQFVNQNNIKKEDIVAITTLQNVETIYYYG